MKFRLGLASLLALFPVRLEAQSHLPESPIYGTGQQDKYGRSFASLPDLNGDGVEDLAIGVPESDGSGNDAGHIEFRSGADLSVLLGSLAGQNAGDLFGSSMVAIGDVDGDLVPDLAVGAPGVDGTDGIDQGCVSIVSGTTFLPITEFTFAEKKIELGSTLTNVGDRTGDGIDDLLTGAPEAKALVTEGGAAFLLEVLPTGLQVLHRFDGDASTESLGSDVVGLPDTNGDSYPDFAIASPDYHGTNTREGRVQIFSGDPSLNYPHLLSIHGTAAFDYLGSALAAIENPDGSPDPCIVISSRGRTNTMGQTFAGYVAIYNATDGSIVRSMEGDDINQFFGMSLATVDDQDGDGIQDILAGSPLDSSGGPLNHGSADLLSGYGDGVPGGSLVKIYKVRGETALDRCGFEVGQVGDLNGDGCRDLAWDCDTERNDQALETGALHVVRSRRARIKSNQETYVDGDTFTVDGLTYASSLTYLVFEIRSRPGLYTEGISLIPPVFLQVTSDLEGLYTWSFTLPNTGGMPYSITARSYTPHAAAKGRLCIVSDSLGRPIN